MLVDQAAIQAELSAYRGAGGGTVIDCQPPGCGRDGRKLLALSEASGTKIVACTGFHLQKYYPPEAWMFRASQERAGQFFVREIQQGLWETRDDSRLVQAGFIKIACENTLKSSPRRLIEAAAQASLATNTAILIHTERGEAAEEIIQFMIGLGLPPTRLVLCHMDKRPDLELHKQLAGEGVLLEYDTFYRPKYRPEENAWPLLEQMVADGLAAGIAIGTDMADAGLWSRLDGGPGLTGLITQIIPRLRAIGCDAQTIHQLTGGNISRLLARAHIRTD